VTTTKKLFALLLLCACDGPSAPIDAGFDAGIPDVSALPTLAAENAVAPGDPIYEGQQRFLWDAFGTERLDQLPPASFFLELMQTDPLFANQFEAFGFLEDPSDDFPVGFKRGLEDPERMHETCAMCHVARTPDGSLWFGPPNVELEIGRFLVEADARWVAAGNASFLSELNRQKLPGLGPGRFRADSDDHPTLVPADFPTYFSLGQRSALNYLGTGGNVRTEVFLAVYTFGAGSPNRREAVVPFPPPARIDPMLAFMGQLEPPAAPPGDATLVAMGRTIYEREQCDSCHHAGDPSMLGVVTYDDAADGLERLPGADPEFPRGSIRTSAAHRSLIDIDEGVADIFSFIVEHGLSATLSDGYRASDLRMLWFTAPYLHNGSVPTLEDLLRPPAERPQSFVRGSFTIDTTVEGNDNVGHEFGTAITDAERTALAAYLRSL
jgi:hypothetical protein